MTWTHFWDMHSGGEQKLDVAHIYIEAPGDEARAVFYARFKRNPERVTCTCCGKDYSIDSHESIAQLSGCHRDCMPNPRWREEKGVDYLEEPKDNARAYCSVDEYLKRDDVRVIRAEEITPAERAQRVPSEGYVWVDE